MIKTQSESECGYLVYLTLSRFCVQAVTPRLDHAEGLGMLGA